MSERTEEGRERKAAMRVEVNGKTRTVAPGRTVGALLEELGLDPRLVVVERNREIVRRDALDDAELRDGDTLEIVHFVGGG